MFKLRKMLSVITAAVLFISILIVLPLPESTAQAAQPFTVVLNPGHGPASTGSGAVAGGIKESILNEQLTAHVVSALKARGINVIVTNKMTSVANEAPYLLDETPGGTTGSGNSGSSNGQYHFKNQLLPVIQNPSLRLAGVETPNLLITLHHNSTSSSSVRGYEIYYSSTLAPDYGKTSDTVARSADFANMVDRHFAQPGFYLSRRGVFDRENNSLTKYPSIPAVLVEAGYMSNSSELSAVRSSANQAILADRLAAAVSEYAAKYGNSYPAGTPQSVPVSTEPIKASSVKAVANADNASLTISANGVTGAVKEVNFAVWPTGRQDLLKWVKGTQSGNNYTASVNMRDVGNIIGGYTIHAYAKDYQDKDIALGAAVAKMGVKASGTVKILKNADGISLSALISNVTGGAGGIKDVKIAVWPEGRQDKLIWVTAVKSGNNYSARINMRDAGNIIGNYTVHVYAEDYNGTPTGIGAGTVSLGSKPAGTVKAVQNSDGSSMTVSANNVTGGAGGIKEVLFAVWPTGRQDLLKWVKGAQSGNNFTANINMRDVGNIIGNYTVHVYATDYNGAQTGIGATSVNLGSKPKAQSIKVTNDNAPNGTSMTATAAGVTGGAGGIKEVQFAVWPTGRQDLLKWVKGTKSGNNYTAKANMSDFANRAGEYTVHVYAVDNANNTYGIGTGKVNLGPTITKVKAASTKINVGSANPNEATITVTSVTGGTGGVKNVQFAVWPTGKQNLLKWIDAAKIGSDWAAEINISQFDNTYGNYTVHVYATDNNGDQYGIGSAAANLGGKVNTVTTNRSTYETPDMICYVRPGFKASAVNIAVWSDNGGQDDLKWVSAKYNAATDQWIANVQLNTFTSAGKFNIHAYAVNSAGKEVFVNAASVDVKASAFNGYKIMGASSVTAQQLANYITSKGWDNSWYGMTALQFAQEYINICNAEGVKAEVAFAQMCHETNNLKFGGDVTRDQFNFAGLGTTGGGVKGIYFKNVSDGIKSQVQHLKRYASTDSFVLSIAPEYTRYKLVTPGCAPTVELLAGKWASDAGYSAKILNIIDQLIKTSAAAPRTAAPAQANAAAPAMLTGDFEIIESPGQAADESALNEQIPAVQDDAQINPDAELKEEIIEAPEEPEFEPLQPDEDENPQDVNEEEQLPEEGAQSEEPAEEQPSEPTEEEQGEEPEEVNAPEEEAEQPESVNADITLVYFNPQTQSQEQTQLDVSDANPETDKDALIAAAAKLAKSDAFKTEVLNTEETEDGILRVHLGKPVEIAAALSGEQTSDAERAALAALADVYLYYIDGITRIEFVIDGAPYASANLALEAGETFKDKLENVVRG